MTRQQAMFFDDNGYDAYDEELFDEIEASPEVEDESNVSDSSNNS